MHVNFSCKENKEKLNFNWQVANQVSLCFSHADSFIIHDVGHLKSVNKLWRTDVTLFWLQTLHNRIDTLLYCTLLVCLVLLKKLFLWNDVCCTKGENLFDFSNGQLGPTTTICCCKGAPKLYTVYNVSRVRGYVKLVLAVPSKPWIWRKTML